VWTQRHIPSVRLITTTYWVVLRQRTYWVVLRQRTQNSI
jgi:hypothetical protein